MKTAVFILLLLTAPAFGQGPAPEVCEPNPQSEKDLKSLDLSRNVSFIDTQTQKAMISGLLQKYPADTFLNILYQGQAKGGSDTEQRAMIQKYEALSLQHSDNPQYQYLYAFALLDVDTPKAIALLNANIAKYPSYPWSHLELADIFSWGRFSDHPQMRRELELFFGICPNSLDSYAWGLAQDVATPDMAAQYAARLRSRLAGEIDRDHLQMWLAVWNLEFKAVPASEHERVRELVARDLAKLEQLPGSIDVDWLVFLKNGYTLLGDQAALDRVNDELLRDFPKSRAAKRVLDQRWWKAHPAPQPGDSEAKKQAAYREELKLFEEQLQTWPGDTLLLKERFTVANQIEGSSQQQIGMAADALLAAIQNNPDWAGEQLEIARAFVTRSMRLEEVPPLVERGLKPNEYAWVPDRSSDEMISESAEFEFSRKIEAADILVAAARQQQKPEIAKAAIDRLGDRPPIQAEHQSAYWAAKAKFAELTGRKLDALVFYREAIQARPVDFKAGNRDELLESQARLWKELNGSDGAHALFAGNMRKDAAPVGGAWKRPAKDMPAWELSDLHGKTWKLSSFTGKTVFINVWASWCMPCREEHQYLQKLYETLKDRPDIQVLTFNIDGEIGAVAPYMKETGYTFPVLLAKDYVENLLPGTSIPRNWIVDASGKWLWEEADFDAQEWPDRVLHKIEASRTGPCPSR